MNIEKEVRFKISEKIVKEIVKDSTLLEAEKQTVDYVMGWNGFDSLNKHGFICRVREKPNQTTLEIKKRISENAWEEHEIKLSNSQEGIDFLSTLNMKPYLYINRKRTIYKNKTLKVFVDNIDLLGLFVELECLDEKTFEKDVDEFLSKFNIPNKPQKLYGDIFKEKIASDEKFKTKFDSFVKEMTK